MAKSEIPSIIVQQGGSEATNGNLNGDIARMEGHGLPPVPPPARQLSRLSRLSKQEEFDFEECETFAPSPVTIHIEDGSCGDDENNGNEENIAAECIDGLAVASAGNGGELSPLDARKSSDVTSNRSTHRVKLLVRSQAVHDDTSPPPPEPETLTTNTNTLTVTNLSTLALQSHSQSKVAGGNLLGKQGSSQGSIEGSSPSLSRDSSTETYTDSTGIDLQQFIVDTLHKSQKDRMMLLKIEQDLITLVKDNKCQLFKFSAMSSYNRMLVHRVAAFFGLEHNVDKSGTSVIVNKTKNTRIPDLKFQDHIRDELVPEEPKKLILKRDSASFEEGKESPDRQSSLDSKRSKSFEEREEEYEKARARIFNQDSLDILLEGYGESPYSRSHDGTLSSSRRSSQEDLRWVGEPRPWSSTDSDSSGRKGDGGGGGGGFDCEGASKGGATAKSMAGASKSDSEAKESMAFHGGARPTVTKASSFGGISVLSRECSVAGKSHTPKLIKSESLNSAPVSGHIASTPPKASSAPSATVCSPPVAQTVCVQPSVETPPSQSSIASHQPPISPNDSSQSGKGEAKTLDGISTSKNNEGSQVNNHTWVANAEATVFTLSTVASTTTTTTTAPICIESYQTSSAPAHPPFLVAPTIQAPAAIPSHGNNNNTTTGSGISLSSPLNVGNLQHQPPAAPSLAAPPQSQHSPLTTVVATPATPPHPPTPGTSTHHLQGTTSHHHHHHHPGSNRPPPNYGTNPPLIYIPCVTSQVPTVLSHQQNPIVMTAGQMHQYQQSMQNSMLLAHASEQQRQFMQENANNSDIVSQMSSLNFGPGQPPHGAHPGMGQPQSGNGMEFAKMPSTVSQPFFVPSDKGQSYNGQPPSAQVPLYYIQHLAPNVGVQTMRYVCPSQSLTAMKSGEASESPAQTPSPHLSGHPFLPGYSLLTVAPNPDNMGYTSMPYFSYAVSPQAAPNVPPTSTASILPPPSSSRSTQPSPASLPIYPYGNILLTSNGNSLLGAPNSSHLNHHQHHHQHHHPHHPGNAGGGGGGGHHFGPRAGAGGPRASLGGPVPLCVMTNGNGPSLHCPPQAPVGPNPANAYALTFRPHTPPSNSSQQSGGPGGNPPGGGPNSNTAMQQHQQHHQQQSGAGTNQQTSPFISYAFYSPPMHQSSHHPNNANSGSAMANAAGGGGGPATVAPGQYPPPPQPPLLHPSFMTSFHVLKPSIPVMSNVRNSTPPPSHPHPPSSTSSSSHPQQATAAGSAIPTNQQQTIIPPQLTTPPPPNHHHHAMKGGNNYLWKNSDHEQHHSKGGNNGHMKSGRMSGPIHVGPPPVRLPNSGPMFRRGLPLLQDVRLVGHPLQQQQMNPLMFPPAPPRSHMTRYPPPHHFNSAQLGQANLTSRSPKVRKPRNKWTGNNSTAGVGAPGLGGGPGGGGGEKNSPGGYNMDDAYCRGNHMLGVEGLPDGMKRSEIERYLEQVTKYGAKIQFSSLEGGNYPSANPGNDFVVNFSKFSVHAIFENETAAHSAFVNIKTTKFQLRPPSQSSQSSPSSSSSSAQAYHHTSHHHPHHHRGGNNHHSSQQHHHRNNHHHKDGSANKSIS